MKKEKNKDNLMYKSIIENAPVAILVNDETGKYIEVNQAACRMLGYSREEFLELSIDDVSIDKDHEINSYSYRTDKQAGETAVEKYKIRKDGSMMAVSLKAIDIDQKIHVSFCTDITERKYVETKLQESELKYRNMVEDINDIIFELDLLGTITYISPVVLRVSGYMPGEMIGRNFSEFIYPDDIKDLYKDFINVLNGQEYEAEYRVISKSGDIQWLRFHGKQVIDDGEIIGARGICTDITDKKQAELDLEDSRELYQALFDSTTDAVYLHYLSDDCSKDNIFEVNDRACTMLGYSKKEFLDRKISDIDVGGDDIDFPDIIKRMLQGEIVLFERVHQAKNGNNIPVEITCRIIDYKGKKAVYSSARDVTERKKSENALIESEERFHQLFENINTGVAIYRPVDDGNDFVFLDVNKALQNDAEMEKKDLLGHKLTHVFPEVEKLGLLDTFRRVHATGISESLPVITYKESRIQVWIESYVFRLPSGLIVAIYEDTSEKRKAEEELLKWSVVFKNAGWGIAIFSEDGKTIELANPAFSKMHGYTEDEISGIPAASVCAPEKISDIPGINNEILLKGHMTYETVHIGKDGRRFPVLVNATVIKNDEGEIRFRIANIQDISIHKEAEHNLKNSLHEKETLLRELYHRTKNNMQVIISLLTLQTHRIESIQFKTLIKETKERIQSIALVHQMLYQSKNLSQVELEEYIRELINLLMQSYKESSEKISVIYDVEGIATVIDIAIPVGLVLNELVTNSIKHAFKIEQKGEIVIKINKTKEGEIKIEYSDNGKGLPDDFDIKNVGTLGIQTIVNIVKHQLNGKVEFMGNDGFFCCIFFSDSIYKKRI